MVRSVATLDTGQYKLAGTQRSLSIQPCPHKVTTVNDIHGGILDEKIQTVYFREHPHITCLSPCYAQQDKTQISNGLFYVTITTSNLSYHLLSSTTLPPPLYRLIQGNLLGENRLGKLLVGSTPRGGQVIMGYLIIHLITLSSGQN